MTLPDDNEDYRNSAILAFLLAQEAAWKAIKWVLKDKIAIEVAWTQASTPASFFTRLAWQ
jgi:hypothetical protein